jgi:hypothetical protein
VESLDVGGRSLPAAITGALEGQVNAYLNSSGLTQVGRRR